MRFIIFVIDNHSNSGTGSEIQEIDKFNSELTSKGQMVLAAGIAGSEMGTLVDNRHGAGLASGGSLNGQDFYSGFWIIDAETTDEAKALAMQGSQACARRVELRPFL